MDWPRYGPAEEMTVHHSYLPSNRPYLAIVSCSGIAADAFYAGREATSGYLNASGSRPVPGRHSRPDIALHSFLLVFYGPFASAARCAPTGVRHAMAYEDRHAQRAQQQRQRKGYRWHSPSPEADWPEGTQGSNH